MIRSDSIRIIAVDGTYPEFNTLKNKNYTYTTEVYLMIREDSDKSSIAYQLYELLLTSTACNRWKWIYPLLEVEYDYS